MHLVSPRSRSPRPHDSLYPTIGSSLGLGHPTVLRPRKSGLRSRSTQLLALRFGWVVLVVWYEVSDLCHAVVCFFRLTSSPQIGEVSAKPAEFNPRFTDIWTSSSTPCRHASFPTRNFALPAVLVPVQQHHLPLPHISSSSLIHMSRILV